MCSLGFPRVLTVKHIILHISEQEGDELRQFTGHRKYGWN